MTTNIKITALTDIGANIAYGSLVPVVNMAGTPTTEKANLQIVGNLILNGAGGPNFVAAAEAITAGTVTTAAQPNITTVGTLTSVAVSGTTNLGAVGNITIAGGSDTFVLSTNGAGTLSWVAKNSGAAGVSGYSGINGAAGVSGWSGIDGLPGASGADGASGISGWSGIDGLPGQSGISGWSGLNGAGGTGGISGYSGLNGLSGTSGYSGIDGTNGSPGTSGYSGVTGFEAAYSSGYYVLADGPSSKQFSVTGDVTADFTPGKIVKFTIITEAEFTVDTAVYDGINLWTVVTLLEVIGGPVVGDGILFEVSGVNEIYPADTMAFTLNGPILTMGVTGIYFPGNTGDWAGTAPTTIYAALDRIANLVVTLNSSTPIP